MKVVYLSVVGNTRRFVHKLGVDALELDDLTVYTEMDEPFILITPTYEIEATDLNNDFLETGNNINLCKGVIGAGNLNFESLYCFTAKDLVEDYDIPLLYTFEFMGNQKDVDEVKRLLAEL